MQVTLERIEDVAHNIATLWFRPEKDMRYDAGQFIELTLKHDQTDKRGEKRWFTVSSSPTEAPLVSITTKFAESDSSSFKQALRTLEPGSTLKMSGPMGDFVLPKDPSRPLLFIAGGIGITPFRSIIKWLIDTGEKRDIQLIYTAHHADEFAFSELFKQYGLSVHYVVTNPEKAWTGLTGIVTAQTAIELIPGYKDNIIYMSGPEPMVESLVNDFRRHGVPGHHLVGDYFPNYPPPEKY